MKALDLTLASTVAVIRIRQIINKVSIKIDIHYILIKQKSKSKFQDNPIVFLVFEYDKKSKQKCHEIELNEPLDKIQHLGSYILKHNNKVIDNNISETVRIIDAKKAEYNYAFIQL